jgi:hypothetical protein
MFGPHSAPSLARAQTNDSGTEIEDYADDTRRTRKALPFMNSALGTSVVLR